MVEGKQAKYSEPVTITAQSVSNFLEMLAAKGLKDQFLAEAPKAKTVLAAGQSDEIVRSAKSFSAKAGVKPDVLASGIDKLTSNKTSVPTEVWQASLSVEPDLMEFARSFVLTHNLAADFKIAKSLKAGKCGDGKECPPGV
ncbi:hypothetical protein [Rhizobium leguminosarum]|uniref:hypothetical protein n=1 Tax=Rhizobium leguminosarum TaxID=384 RepID=UPI00143F18C1|nr:hypothetical protein [Rhizobium leguminosarum]NKL21813.1 hypothetical protein [Rhizobium leguminosarum bv. viciae]